MVKDEDLDVLLNMLFEKYGYDFTNYAKASLKRRVNRLMVIDRLPSFAELLYKIKGEPDYLPHVVEQITVNVTEMFRDPLTFKTIREKVLPILATHPFIRVWHAGCASGEEVYSMAILLEEAGLLHKSLLYATDLNPSVIENIQKGIFPLSQMKQFSENYILSGGKKQFSDYYTAKYDWAKFDDKLKTKMIAATHNLVSDRSFNEFQIIFCRNVLIYFDKVLQDKVLNLFDESLEKLGFLVLGAKENIRFSKMAKNYLPIGRNEKIWRKML
ncbi:protein-glutamate O-methyltransferase CheR [Flavisolibacter ginsenosidimutans]|uniref:Protein-glutamate O-methyltransferase CheR n=1 Tax=Flavisolibacter ginsenosidimutans TaxID=661481 RepID=A0A5B8UR54_9BACT|nr:protein-glutamate O-methyltransferase CheR [Flavisolibacter ginsenosidimutans]